jgi:hypothetical protein
MPHKKARTSGLFYDIRNKFSPKSYKDKSIESNGADYKPFKPTAHL